MAKILRSKNHIYGLNAELAALAAANAAELARAQAAEAALTQAVLDEKARAEAAEAALNTAITGEATARAAADAAEITARDAAIVAAKLALGTRYRADDIAGRDALTGLDLADIVFVTDAGDGKWATYQPYAIDGNGAGTAWTVMSDEDTYLNANTAASIKAAYESNPNTQAFTDAEKAKLALVSATSAIDLDKVIQNDEFVTDPTLAGVTDTQLASAAAVKAYVQAAANAGGALFNTQNLVVTNGKIVLAFKPKDGMILNFATVRHVDANSVAEDIPVIADVADLTGKTYVLATDVAGELDTKTVTVQYPYTL